MVDRKTIALAVLTGAVVFAGTALLYHQRRDVVVDFENAFEGGIVSEFHNRERAGTEYFRWSKAVSYLDFQNLPTRGTIEVEARLRIRRPGGEPLPNLAFTANGATVHATRGLPGLVTYNFELPASRSHVRLALRSDTFDPSGERPLGVQVLGVTVKLPDERPSWVAPSAWMALSAVLLFGAAWIATREPIASAAGALVFSGAFAYLLAQHAVRFTAYPREVALLSGVALGLAILIGRFTKDPRAAVTSTILVVFVAELAVALYPLTVHSDARFQANRMTHFLDGDWHPTSVTQHEDPFQIPYPVSLYAVTAPLAALGVDLVRALALVTALGDVLVSVLLIGLAWRYAEDLRAGVLAAFFYQLIPMNASSFSAGNFTNLFAVSMLTLAFWFFFRRPVSFAVATLLALTAHFGMLLEGVVLWPAWVLLLWLLPVPAEDRRKPLTAAFLASFATAGAYYLGYLELVTSQWRRALEGGAGSGGTGGFQSLAHEVGWLVLLMAALGAHTIRNRPVTPTFRGALFVWVGVSLLFFGIHQLSALEIRYALQALPVLALLSGIYVASAFDRDYRGKIAGGAAILYMAFVGLSALHDVVLVNYH